MKIIEKIKDKIRDFKINHPRELDLNFIDRFTNLENKISKSENNIRNLQRNSITRTNTKSDLKEYFDRHLGELLSKERELEAINYEITDTRLEIKVARTSYFDSYTNKLRGISGLSNVDFVLEYKIRHTRPTGALDLLDISIPLELTKEENLEVKNMLSPLIDLDVYRTELDITSKIKADSKDICSIIETYYLRKLYGKDTKLEYAKDRELKLAIYDIYNK